VQHLRKVSSRLAHLGEERWTATTLYVLGKADGPKPGLIELLAAAVSSGFVRKESKFYEVESPTRKLSKDVLRMCPRRR